MLKQQGFGYLPVLLGMTVIVILIGGYIYSFNPNLLRAPSQQTPQAISKEDGAKDQEPPCKPQKRENGGSCALGKVEIFASRKLSASALENILKKHNLSIEYAFNTSDPAISLVRLDQGLSKEDWERKLNVSPAKKVSVGDVTYTDGVHMVATVYFDRSISDEQIQQYIKSNDIEKYIQEQPPEQDRFILHVPDGTEYDWDEKLKNESPNIILVRPYYPSYAEPL